MVWIVQNNVHTAETWTKELKNGSTEILQLFWNWTRQSTRHFIEHGRAYIELWMHLGSLESTQEARVALCYRL